MNSSHLRNPADALSLLDPNKKINKNGDTGVLPSNSAVCSCFELPRGIGGIKGLAEI